LLTVFGGGDALMHTMSSALSTLHKKTTTNIHLKPFFFLPSVLIQFVCFSTSPPRHLDSCLETSLLACLHFFSGATFLIGWTISVIHHSLIHLYDPLHHLVGYSLTFYLVGHWIQLLEVFYLTRTGFTLDELVSLVKVFRPFRLELIFLGVQSVDTVGRCTKHEASSFSSPLHPTPTHPPWS